MSNKITNRFYTEERFLRVAQEAASSMEFTECQAWLKHPCTKALTSTIEAELCATLSGWLDATYVGESADMSVMMDNKARGMAHALEDVLTVVDDIGNKKLAEKDEEID